MRTAKAVLVVPAWLLMMASLVFVGPLVALGVLAYSLLLAAVGFVSWLPQAPKDIARFGRWVEAQL